MTLASSSDEGSTSDQKLKEGQDLKAEAREALYTSLYEQYYGYYYNYYYQLHMSNGELPQDSSPCKIEEDSRSLAVNAAVYAAKAKIEQQEKEQEEKDRLESEKSQRAARKRAQCIIVRYLEYVSEHGTAFSDLATSRNGLPFLDRANENHSFYEACLARLQPPAVVMDTQAAKEEEKEVIVVEETRPGWRDYLTMAPGDSEGVQRLAAVVRLVTSLEEAEAVGRASAVARDLRASRKRKAAAFLEAVERRKVEQQRREEPRAQKRTRKASKHRKHRHR